MAYKPQDGMARQTSVVQVCLTPTEEAVLAAYAKAEHEGKLSIAARHIIRGQLTRIPSAREALLVS